MDETLDARRERLLADDPGAAEVDLEDLVDVLAAHRRQAGDVEDAIDTLERAPNRAAVGDVAVDPLELDSLEPAGRRGAPDQEPQIVAPRRQRPGEMRPDEARSPGHQRLRHRPGS